MRCSHQFSFSVLMFIVLHAQVLASRPQCLPMLELFLDGADPELASGVMQGANAVFEAVDGSFVMTGGSSAAGAAKAGRAQFHLDSAHKATWDPTSPRLLSVTISH